MVRGPIVVGSFDDINSCGHGSAGNAVYNTAHDTIPGTAHFHSDVSHQYFSTGQSRYPTDYNVLRGIQLYHLDTPEGRNFLVTSAHLSCYVSKPGGDFDEFLAGDGVYPVDAKNELGTRSLQEHYGDMNTGAEVSNAIGSMLAHGDMPGTIEADIDVGVCNVDSGYRSVYIGYRSAKDIAKEAPSTGKMSVFTVTSNGSISFYYLVVPLVSASGVSTGPDSMVLTGSVDDSDGLSSVYMQYVPATWYEGEFTGWYYDGDWSDATSTPVRSKSNGQTWDEAIAGLTPAQGYAVRAVGYNTAGYIYSIVVYIVTDEGEPAPVEPTAHYFHISAIRHTYRSGSYRAELTFGDVTATPEVVMLEIALPKKKEPAPVVTPEDKTPKIEEPPVVVTVPEKTAPELMQAMIEQSQTQFDLNSKINLFPSSDDMTLRQPPLPQMPKELQKEILAPTKAGDKAETVFAERGYTTKDILAMVKKGMKPAEILELLRKGK